MDIKLQKGDLIVWRRNRFYFWRDLILTINDTKKTNDTKMLRLYEDGSVYIHLDWVYSKDELEKNTIYRKNKQIYPKK